MLMALLGLWYNNFFGAETELIVPYSSLLDRFTTYLQQLNMESNGKSVAMDGSTLQVNSGPVVWGEPVRATPGGDRKALARTLENEVRRLAGVARAGRLDGGTTGRVRADAADAILKSGENG